MATYTKKPVTIEAFQLSDFHEEGYTPLPWFIDAINKDIVTLNDDQTATIETLEGQHLANKDDYIIKGIKGELYPCKPDIFEATYFEAHEYDDGYTSWSPKDAFEKGYKEKSAIQKAFRKEVAWSGEMNFGMALEALKEGEKVARKGWNGKNMFAYYVPASKHPIERNANMILDGVFPDNIAPYRHYLALKTAQNDIATWSPSTSDALAEDWEIIE